MEEISTKYDPPVPTRRASLPTRTQNYYNAPTSRMTVRARSVVEEDIEDQPTRTNTSVRKYQRPLPPVPVQVKEEPVTQPLEGWTFQRFFTYVCISIGISLMLIVAFLALVLPRIVDAINTMKYENPRITQADVVFNGQSHHLIALNEHGTIEMVDIPANPNKAKPEYYVVVHLIGDGMDEKSVTNISMMDANGDGDPDIEITVNNTQYILYGDGKGDFFLSPPAKGK